MLTSSGENQIHMHNTLVRHTMTTLARLASTELRLVAYLIHIGIPNPGPGGVMPRRVRANVFDFAKHCGLAADGKFYAAVRVSTEQLMQSLIRFQVIREGKLVPVSTTWLAEGEYHEGEGWFEVQFSDSMQGLLTELSKHRTVMQLETMLGLGASQYAIRLWQLAKSYESLRGWVTTIATLREQLGVPEESYSRLNDFRKMVLDYPIGIINDRSDLVLSYEKHNFGRKWTELAFQIQTKTVNPKGRPEKPCKAPEGFGGLTSDERAECWRWYVRTNHADGWDPENPEWERVGTDRRDTAVRWWMADKRQTQLPL